LWGLLISRGQSTRSQFSHSRSWENDVRIAKEVLPFALPLYVPIKLVLFEVID
jgi:hypothetical protein